MSSGSLFPAAFIMKGQILCRGCSPQNRLYLQFRSLPVYPCISHTPVHAGVKWWSGTSPCAAERRGTREFLPLWLLFLLVGCLGSVKTKLGHCTNLKDSSLSSALERGNLCQGLSALQKRGTARLLASNKQKYQTSLDLNPFLPNRDQCVHLGAGRKWIKTSILTMVSNGSCCTRCGGGSKEEGLITKQSLASKVL